MKVTFKTGSEVNYGSTNGEMFFASDTKQLLLNGVKYIPKKLSELTNDSGYLTSITKSMVENVLTGNVKSHTHTFASITSKPNTLLGYGITETDFFSFDTHISNAGVFFRNDYANNLLYAIDKRANVTATTFTNISSLFNLNYDSYQKIEAGNTEVILIENLNKVIPMLAYGYLYVQLYWDNYAENITVEVYSKNGGADYKWRALSGLNNIYLWTFNNVNINYDIDKIRIAIKAKSDTSCLVSQILFLGRRMSINNSPLITNYIPNTFLYDVTAPKYVVTGGTSSQFLKGDGSLDSNTYALSSALNNYLPLSGGTLIGNLTCNGSYINMNGASGAKGYRGYFNNSQSADRGSGSHIFNSGWAYGTNAISLGASAYAGIRNTDSDSGTYPYLHWKWMNCLQVKEVTKDGDVNCYGAILNNSGGTKDTAKFTVCVDGVCKFYDESKGDNDPTNQFLKFTNTDANFGRVVVFIANTDTLIFGGNTSYPRRTCSLKIGNMILGQGSRITDVASMTINGKTVYRLAIYWWSGNLSASYDITKATTTMVCTKVNSSIYNGESSYASGYYSVASGYCSVASGYYSVASGNYSIASGDSSIASGNYSIASGNYSVAKHEGSKVYALRGVSGRAYQTVLGRDNVETSGAVVVGWGASDTSRKNIFVLDTSGNATFGSGGAGTVTAANFNGALSGTATSFGMDTIKVYANGGNEINFGGTSTNQKILIGYQSKDSRPVPNYFVFSKGTATIEAANFTGNAATATKLAKQIKIKVGSGEGKSFDGSGNIEFTLNNIITQSDTINVGTINVAEKLTTDKIEVKNNLTISSGVDIEGLTPSMISAAAASHTHTFASLESKPTTLSGYGITDAMYFYEGTNYLAARFNNAALATKAANTYIEFWQTGAGWFNLMAGKFITDGGTSSQFLKGDGSLDSNTYALSSALNNYLPLSGGTLNGNLTVPTLTSTGGIVLGDSSLSAMVSSIGIQRYDETGFIGFLKDFNLGGSFNGVVLGWDGNYSLSTNSVRIDASTFTYKGNSVLHSGNLGYTSSGLSRAVQKDANGNLFIVAPSLFEQGISNNYPKNLRWITDDEGQLVFDTEETAGVPSTVQVSIPVANGTSKGFLKSTSTVTNVTGYTPCPVKSGTPYYKLNAIGLDYTDLGIVSGSIESNVPINTTIQQDGILGYLLNYTVDNIPRLLTIALGSYCKYFFWLQQTDDDTPIVAYYHCQFNNLWLVIDSPNREIRISQGGF